MVTPRDPTAIFVDTVVMPLFVPTDDVYGAKRVKNGNSSFIRPDAEDVGEIVLSAWTSLHDEAASLNEMYIAGLDDKRARNAERAAYAALLLGEPETSSKIIQRSLAEELTDPRPFVLDSLARMRTVGDHLSRDDVAGALEVLTGWTSESKATLGLQKT